MYKQNLLRMKKQLVIARNMLGDPGGARSRGVTHA
jgi:hypothetical protein